MDTLAVIRLMPDRWSWRTCKLASLFRAYGERTGKTPIHLSKTVRGKLSCPLALYIEKSLAKYRAKTRLAEKIFCKPYALFFKPLQVEVLYRQYEFQRQMLAAILVQLAKQARFFDNQRFKLPDEGFHRPLVTMLGCFD